MKVLSFKINILSKVIKVYIKKFKNLLNKFEVIKINT